MDTALKQRLIGAIVLVALAVIFLPMLIKGPAPESGVSNVPLDVPATPAGDYETRELPLVTPGQTPQGGAVGLDGRPPAAAEVAGAAEATEPDSSSMLPPSTAGGNYAVNFGAYATVADAEAVIARLKQSGFPGYREPTTINGSTAYRVRIGPYADRASAETVRLQAGQVRSDVRTQVVALDAAPPAPPAAVPTSAPPAPPAPKVEPSRPVAAEPAPKPAAPKPAAPAPPKPAPTPAPAAAAPSVGFAVQVGAFTRNADANALRDKLRAGGFSAFVEQVQTDKGMLSRVRVGPVSSRAAADQLKAQVAAKTGMNGMVLSHP